MGQQPGTQSGRRVPRFDLHKISFILLMTKCPGRLSLVFWTSKTRGRALGAKLCSASVSPAPPRPASPRLAQSRPAVPRSAPPCPCDVRVLDSASVCIGFPLFVLPKNRPGRLSTVLWGSKNRGPALGTPLRPASVPPRPDAPRRPVPHPAPPRPWDIRVLDSTRKTISP